MSIVPWKIVDYIDYAWPNNRYNRLCRKKRSSTLAVVVADSTTTLERHVSMSFSGTGNMNVWTRGVLAGGGAVASSVRTGTCIVPKTPVWSKKEVVRMVVPPIWPTRCLGSQMVRWSMHVARPGWCGGVKVKVSAPSHIKHGRDWTLASFGVKLVQPP